MAGNTSAVSVSSNALILLGAEPIQDFSGNDAGTVAASNLFNTTYQDLLQAYDWDFARKYRELARSAATPDSGYNYKFLLPSDCLRVISTSSYDYQIAGGEIHTNDSQLKIEYVASVEINLAPVYFVNALEYMMAGKLAIPVTGDIDKADIYTKLAMQMIRKARHLDARQTPTQDIISKPFIDVRNA